MNSIYRGGPTTRYDTMGRSTRRSAYLIGLLLQGPVQGFLDGWNYNIGRERAQRRREQEDAEDVTEIRPSARLPSECRG